MWRKRKLSNYKITDSVSKRRNVTFINTSIIKKSPTCPLIGMPKRKKN